MRKIGSTGKQDKNYEISNTIIIDIALVIFNKLKLQSGFVFKEKKNKKNSLLYSFNIKMLKFLLFMLVDKDSLPTHN